MAFSRICHIALLQSGRHRLRWRIGHCLQNAVYVLVLYFASQSLAFAERYSVEKDSFGNYSAKKVEASPASKKQTKVGDSQSANSPDKVSLAAENVVPDVPLEEAIVVSGSDSAPAALDGDNQNGMPTPREEGASNSVGTTDALPVAEQEQRKLSIFERKYLEAELAERERILKAIKSAERTASDYDATEVNPEDFIDSEEQLRSANKQVKERSPYYVTVDEQGRPQTTFYDPTLVKEILFIERNKKIQYTKAQVYKRGEPAIKIPESADPVALSILTGGKDQFVSYFDKFSMKCCEQLPNIQTPQITIGNYHYFVLSDDSLPYRFAEGDSRFLLLRLPDMNQSEIPFRIRSFIRKFADQNIERGVFYPQIVTLDKNKEPLRIISEPLLAYEEETWTTHAYLQGIFALSQTSELDERYVLINTTRKMLESTSSIDLSDADRKSDKRVTLQHMNEGSFEIEILL